MAQAQVSGEVEISTANSQVIADADLRGGNLVAMGAVINEVAFYVMPKPEIKAVSDLKRQAGRCDTLWRLYDFAIRQLLQKYGLQPITACPSYRLGECRKLPLPSPRNPSMLLLCPIP
jgi:hypothetical protein